MDEKELNKRAAELVGWTWTEDIRFKGTSLEMDCSFWGYKDKDDGYCTLGEPVFTEDSNHTRLLLAEIERLGLRDALVCQLFAIFYPNGIRDDILKHCWNYVSATPAQITAAFIATLEAHGAAAGGEE